MKYVLFYLVILTGFVWSHNLHVKDKGQFVAEEDMAGTITKGDTVSGVVTGSTLGLLPIAPLGILAGSGYIASAGIAVGSLVNSLVLNKDQ